VVDDERTGARTAPAAREGKLSRRAILAGGVGTGVLVALPDVLTATPARAAATQASPPSHFFLYGSPGSASAPALQGWRPPSARGAAAAPPRVIGSGLAARPARSADGATIAFPTVRSGPSGAEVTLTLVAAATAAIESSATLHLPGVAHDASVLVRPVFAAGAATVALVIAVTTPTNWHAFRKAAADGTAATTPSATWTTHHVLAYLDRAAGTFSEPFDLRDAPALAWTDAAADARNLYLWTIREPAASVGTKQNPLPAPPTRVPTFPLGSGRPVSSARSAGAWPNGATGLVLATGEIARTAEGRDLEVYSPRTGTSTRLKFTELRLESARAGATNVHLRADGTLVIANAAFGRAIVVDPAHAYRTVTVLDYPRPKIAIGGPDAKTALSPDGATLYTLGPASTGGLSAYDLASGELVAAYGDGAHYSGLHQLPSGTLLAVNGTEGGSQLGFFSPSLARLGAGSTDMYVAEVF
jgi:multisubunit Na+/H+ antiporter MnhG subunit